MSSKTDTFLHTGLNYAVEILQMPIFVMDLQIFWRKFSHQQGIQNILFPVNQLTQYLKMTENGMINFSNRIEAYNTDNVRNSSKVPIFLFDFNLMKS